MMRLQPPSPRYQYQRRHRRYPSAVITTRRFYLLLTVVVYSFFITVPAATTTTTCAFLLNQWISTSASTRHSALPAKGTADGDIYTVPDLRGKVAIVTGASRGIGKGIALELGRAGMTVYVASRTSRSSSASSSSSQATTTNTTTTTYADFTVERTAEEINNRITLPDDDDAAAAAASPEKGERYYHGYYRGRAIPVPMDVSNDKEIAALIAKVREECGRLDAVICSAFTTPPSNSHRTDASSSSSSSSLSSTSNIRDEFWKQGGEMWDACHNVSLRGSYITCCESVPLMMETTRRSQPLPPPSQEKDTATTAARTERPLIAIISSFGAKSYTFNVAYGVSKAGTDRLVSDMAVELSKHNIDTISIYPGIVRTENNLEMLNRGEWNAASGGLDLQNGETTQFTGRAVALLLSKPEIRKARSGKVVVVAELAKELEFTDLDGRTPPSIRSLKFLLPTFVFPMVEKQMGSGVSLPNWLKESVPDYLLPWFIFSGGPPPTIERT